jgi:hypothetical protein
MVLCPAKEKVWKITIRFYFMDEFSRKTFSVTKTEMENDATGNMRKAFKGRGSNLIEYK